MNNEVLETSKTNYGDRFSEHACYLYFAMLAAGAREKKGVKLPCLSELVISDMHMGSSGKQS